MRRILMFSILGVLLMSSELKADEQLDTLTKQQAIEISNFLMAEHDVIILFPCCHSHMKKSIGIDKVSVFTDNTTGTYRFQMSGKDCYGQEINEKVDVHNIFYKNGFKAKCVVESFDIAIEHPRAFRWKKYW